MLFLAFVRSEAQILYQHVCFIWYVVVTKYIKLLLYYWNFIYLIYVKVVAYNTICKLMFKILTEVKVDPWLLHLPLIKETKSNIPPYCGYNICHLAITSANCCKQWLCHLPFGNQHLANVVLTLPQHQAIISGLKTNIIT